VRDTAHVASTGFNWQPFCLDKNRWSLLHASLPQWERFVKDDRAVKCPVRTSRIGRNDASFAIPQRAIELLGAIPLARIKHKQRSLTVTGDLFNHLHERSPDPPTALTGEDKEFLHFGPMPRIRFRRQSQLDRSNDPTRVARHEKHAGALGDFLKDRPPIVLRILCV
jgi:hypothetical protein